MRLAASDEAMVSDSVCGGMMCVLLTASEEESVSDSTMVGPPNSITLYA